MGADNFFCLHPSMLLSSTALLWGLGTFLGRRKNTTAVSAAAASTLEEPVSHTLKWRTVVRVQPVAFPFNDCTSWVNVLVTETPDHNLQRWFLVKVSCDPNHQVINHFFFSSSPKVQTPQIKNSRGKNILSVVFDWGVVLKGWIFPTRTVYNRF